ncbi:MAG: hypothetical protein V1676_05930 [Candidatus Diapherotrites archaeon]
MGKRLIFAFLALAAFSAIAAHAAAAGTDEAPGLGLDCNKAKEVWDEMRTHPSGSIYEELQGWMSYIYWENQSAKAGSPLRWWLFGGQCNLFCNGCKCIERPFYMHYYLDECPDGKALGYPEDYPLYPPDSSPYPPGSSSGYRMPHCQWVGDGDSISMDGKIYFIDAQGAEKEAQPLEGEGPADYSVSRMGTLLIKDIGTFNTSCVDGVAMQGVTPPMRVYARYRNFEKGQWGAWQGPSNNYSTDSDQISCHGGKFLKTTGGNSFEAYSFGNTGYYDVSVQYAVYSNGAKWQEWKRLTIVVPSIRAKITAPKAAHLGFFKEEGKEGKKSKDFVWEIENTGESPFMIKEVTATGCGKDAAGKDTGLECKFPAFASGTLVEPGASYMLQENVSASRPAASPQKKEFGIDVKFADEFGLDAENMGEVIPVGQDLIFTAVGYSFTPYEKGGIIENLAAGEYYLQVCTDSDRVAGVIEPMISLVVEYDAGDEKNPDMRVANATFHASDHCSGGKFFYYSGNDGTNTAKIVLKKDQNLHWTLRGKVGIESAGPGAYKSDWARIGKKINKDTNYVEGFEDVLDANIGAQKTLSKTSGPHSGKVSIDDGIIKLGSFKEQVKIGPPANGGMAPISYGLTGVVIGGKPFTGISSSYTSTISDPKRGDMNTSLWIDEASADVFASTQYYKVKEDAKQNAELALLWLDREQFVIRVGSGQAGVCHDAAGTAGFSGSAAVPRVNYNWSWDSIGANGCDAGNDNYIYCDATQFGIELVQRLNAIKELTKGGGTELDAESLEELKGLMHFQVYLMRDAFTDDFRKDFDNYMNSSVFADTPSYYTQGWSKYFTDKGRLVFDVADAADTTLRTPGLYNVDISLEFPKLQDYVFFLGEEPNAEIKVLFTKLPFAGGAESAASVLYYLPFDAGLGLNPSTGKFEREGYGVGFGGDTVPLSLSTAGGGALVETIPADKTKGPLVNLAVAEISDFDYLQKQKSGSVLGIERVKEGEYKMEYSPSYATPVIMEAWADAGTAGAFYRIEEGNEILGKDGGYLSYWRAIAENISDGKECADYAGEELPYAKADYPASSGDACKLSVQDAGGTFGLAWETGLAGKIYLESVFYTPLNSSMALANACSSTGRFYSKLNRADPGSASRALSLKGYGQDYGSVQGMLQGIKAGELCATSGGEHFDVWWNAGKLSEEMRNAMSDKSPVADPCPH